ncbi:PqqD family peptide modification chaperone [Nocardia sp. NPDC050175]|uniref:PqqD family peptide modification chaperone n=1 Tax=Nocardia sp. NPDC050175 TaxID=3364317 RepID=UPI00378EAE9A
MNVSILADGRLELFSPVDGAYFAGNAWTAAIWIAFQQHACDPARAADALAAFCQSDPNDVRADLAGLIDELLRRGLLEYVPDPDENADFRCF